MIRAANQKGGVWETMKVDDDNDGILMRTFFLGDHEYLKEMIQEGCALCFSHHGKEKRSMTTTPVSRMLYPKPWELAVWANQHRYPVHERVPLLTSSEILLDETYLNLQELETHGSIIKDVSRLNQVNTASFIEKLLPKDHDNKGPPVTANLIVSLGPPADSQACVPSAQLAYNTENPIPRAGVRRIVRRCRIKPDVPSLVKKTLRLNELVVRHESWIDTRKRQLIIVSINETWSGTATIGDVTVYRALDDPKPFRGKIPVVTLQNRSSADKTLSDLKLVSETACLFLQYAFFQVNPQFKIPFRSSIESSILKCYSKNTQEGRQIDMEFMQHAVQTGLHKQLMCTSSQEQVDEAKAL